MRLKKIMERLLLKRPKDPSKDPSYSRTLLAISFLVVLYLNSVQSEVLVPILNNIASNKKIVASSTCGENTRDLYCKLVGANAGPSDKVNIIQGQVCDYCDSNQPGLEHPIEFAIDGTERWWQSPPLSRGTKYNEVNVTIDLGQDFHVAYLTLTSGNSPRPGVWILERSNDNGETYRPWQYFADSMAECITHFGKESIEPITKDDDVRCETKYSKIVPLERGEVIVRLLDNRPSRDQFFDSEVLQDWSRATNIRLRFLRTKNLFGDLMSVGHQDPTITRRYFYSIKDIQIGGRCRCHGHSDTCDITDPDDQFKLLCRCQHNTCGSQCETCCPGFVQKAWRPSTNQAPFVCERCNCYSHSEECYYDEEVDKNNTSVDIFGNSSGGGVCVNCRDNTEGINCHKCISKFYRPYDRELDALNVCQPCDCENEYSTGNCEEGTGKCECRENFLSPDCDQCNTGYYEYPQCEKCDCYTSGTRGDVCEVGGGQCPCKHNFSGKNCDMCADGYYDFPNCYPCQCHETTSINAVCDPNDGQCECEHNFRGRACDMCEHGYFNFPECQMCKCVSLGAVEDICDKESGTCLCKEGYGGIEKNCDGCEPDFFGYPDCRACLCSIKGSQLTTCESKTGQCSCLQGFSTRTCEQCSPGYYKFPDCFDCKCDQSGSMGVSCDDEGKCQCHPNFDGQHCDKCKEGFYNFPECEECNCDPAGVTETFSGCGDSPPGELCQCKERVTGRICRSCKPRFWNLQQYNPLGCEDCECHLPGVIGGVQVCDGKNGDCECKSYVTSRRCQDCKDGFFNLEEHNILGCSDCRCDVGGAVTNNCDKEQGQCICRPRITGQTCSKPLQTHYFPTLYQFQYEAEDGITPNGGQVRFGYDENDFPNHSWVGYAVYSQLQPETIHDVYVDKSALYRLIIHYKNPSEQTIIGEVTLIPVDGPRDDTQKHKVKYEPNENFVTVSTSNIPYPFVLNTGRWEISLKSDQHLLIDYFTLLPSAYYEATILQKKVSDPCLINVTKPNDKNIYPESCVKMAYPIMDDYDSALGTKSYISFNEIRDDPNDFYKKKSVMKKLGVDDEDGMVLLTPDQNEIGLDLTMSKGGRYALVIEYFTPEGSNLTKINVEATSKKGTTKGSALIYNCIHATLCREVVTNLDGEVAIFRFDQSAIKIAIDAPKDELKNRIAIHKVTAVPMGRWTINYVRPNEYCIMRNGTCIESSFEDPPDTLKLEAEKIYSEEETVSGEDLPHEASENKILKLLDKSNKTVIIPGIVGFPDFYSFIVHYYQPDNPDFMLDVLIENGQHYQAKTDVVHCPSTAGCRAVISQEDGNSKFYIEDNFKITIKSAKKIWIDYLIVVPLSSSSMDSANAFSKYLAHRPQDDTRRFIEQCGKNHFNIPLNATGFCRDAVFSLTTELNNGALSCDCNAEGSISFECEEFGGQCPCKDNIIGRKCNKCTTGFFGFPNCERCDCPSTALCDQITGNCICPPRVVGEKCENCAPNTFGFDALIGCEDCACQPLGVADGNMQCNLLNGQCDCKQNIIGRKCDKCMAGYWAFPHCQLCRCSLRGTEKEICDQETSSCFCKANVEGGGACDDCAPGSFNLDESNEKGCTKCFCFGKTTRCTSSSLFWKEHIPSKNKLSLTGFDPFEKLIKFKNYSLEFDSDYDEEALEDVGIFIAASVPMNSLPLLNESHVIYYKIDITGNFLVSYGGNLSYIITSEPASVQDREIFAGPDVILEGNDLNPSTNKIRLMHFAIDHLDQENSMDLNVGLKEENFAMTSSNRGLMTATRDQFMILLNNLTAIYIRAAYWKNTDKVRLSEFSLQMSSGEFSDESENSRALSVEQCQCPRNYMGLSCQECAPGYFRSPQGPFGGFCVPCNCNGHSDFCDPLSGVCFDCQHNTTGDHCEKCQVGYHGDATVGTPGDCLICACPLPIESNNFATGCEVSEDGFDISCQCKDGYVGPRCEACGAGFYGVPERAGDYCKPCGCSGNIDVNDPFACDSVNGECIRCLNNTGGPLCNVCARGYYGDAVEMKNCRECSCSECGTYECDHSLGECQCLPNVIGANCDRCAPDHFGMVNCQTDGCYPCYCGKASYSTQCNDKTGQCDCKKGTTGLNCDRCAPGYWNYSEDGCQTCECNQEYSVGVGCNPENGQCECLPGVIGANCDHCPYRWVLLDNRGCRECDSCQHQLLDSTDAMALNLAPIKSDFDSVAKSYFTTQRLVFLNESADKLEPEVRILDPSKVDLVPFSLMTDLIESDGKKFKQKAKVANASFIDKSKTIDKLNIKAIELASKAQEAVSKAQDVVFETEDLMKSFLEGKKLQTSTPETESAIISAQEIIESMNQVDFSMGQMKAEEENKTAAAVLKDIKVFIKPVNKFNKKLEERKTKFANIKDKLKDLNNQTQYSNEISKKAHELSNKIKDAKVGNKVSVLKDKVKEMEENAENATKNNEGTLKMIENSEESYKSLKSLMSSIGEWKEPLEQNAENIANELENHKNTVQESEEHVQKLKVAADELEDRLRSTKDVSENSVSAANSYKNIVEAIDEAERKARDAVKNAEDTFEITSGVGEDVDKASKPSQNLVALAGTSKKQVEDELKIPLEDYQLVINEIETMKEKTEMTLNEIDNTLGKLPEEDDDIQDDKLQNSIETSEDAIQKIEDSLDSIKEILNILPTHVETAKTLPVTAQDVNKGAENANNLLKQSQENVPLSTAISGGLEDKKPDFEKKKKEIGESMADLKAQIAQARELANRVQVGMNLAEDSSLYLANPESLQSQQVQTKLSVHFKTNEQGGSILYLGNENGNKGEDDFMAIEIRRGLPVLTIDLGSGPQEITNEKYVADDKWYRATVDRIGKNVRFIIAEENQDGSVLESTKEEYLSGPKSLFNVDKNSSKLYVGGLPPGHLQDSRNTLHYSTFVGSIEDLTIGGEKVGLWNFNDAENISPAAERDRFPNLKPETGLRFQGNGYAIMESGNYPFRLRSNVRLNFLTRSKNGLLFLVGKGKKFMSLEIVNGTVVFQYNLGSGTAKIATPKTYNDGKWHVVESVRAKIYGILRVDGEDIGKSQSPMPKELLSVSKYMYFGGYPNNGQHGYSEVTTKHFDGCIEGATIESAQVDLTQAIETRYTVVGCPSSLSDQTVATFFGNGYLKVSSEDSPSTSPVISYNDDTFELSFRFRSNDTHGLIFYGTNEDQTNYLSISVAEGSLYFKTEPGSTQINTGPLNDAEWHYLTVSRDRSRLVLNIDDVHELTEAAPGGPLILNTPGSMLFFGGRPEDYEMRVGSSVSDSLLTGCIADININGKALDFTDATAHGATLSQKCSSEGESVSERLELKKNFIIPDEDSEDDSEYEQISVLTTTTSTTEKQKPKSSEEEEDGNEDEDEDMEVKEDEKEDEMKEKPKPYENCKLFYTDSPEMNPKVSLEDGVEFGNFDRFSRMEFKQKPDDGSKSNYYVELKTRFADGLIFMWSDFDRIDFVALYMLRGKLYFSFNSGFGSALLTSPQTVNDSNWHTVAFIRHFENGELWVDGEKVDEGQSPGSTRNINAGETIYLGGIEERQWSKVSTLKKIQNVTMPFRGCLRNFKLRDRPPTIPKLINSVQPCSERVEDGFSFYKNGGYLKLVEKMKSIKHAKISMMFKPRHPSGLILSIHGKNDYLVLQMINGTIKFTVNSGHGPFTTSYTRNTYDLCDGNWHKLQVSKSKNIATLELDDTHSHVGHGVPGLNAVNHDQIYYLGGHPDLKSRNLKGVEVTEQFVGCISNFKLEINRNPRSVKIAHANIEGGAVGLSNCPLD